MKTTNLVKKAVLALSISAATSATYADVMAQGTITRLDSSTSTGGTFVIEVDGPGDMSATGILGPSGRVTSQMLKASSAFSP
jgi:hypothetical protein